MKLIDLQNTQFCVQKSETYLKFERICVNIVRKFADFSYHGNKSWTDTFHLHIGRPENPLFGAEIFVMSHIQAELNTNFLLNF